jgi:hypothetical protein
MTDDELYKGITLFVKKHSRCKGCGKYLECKEMNCVCGLYDDLSECTTCCATIMLHAIKRVKERKSNDNRT